MIKRIAALSLIFGMTALGWVILGSVTHFRTSAQDAKLKHVVRQLWGTAQKQRAPYVYYLTQVEKKVTRTRDSKTEIEIITETKDHQAILDSSYITVDLGLNHRKKGLLWYSTYRVLYSGEYIVKNTAEKERDFFFVYTFPTNDGIYDNFKMTIDGKEIEKLIPSNGKVTKQMKIAPGNSRIISISYGSQGMDEWWYIFGSDISQIRNLTLIMTTDFEDIDFPENSISPVKKERTESGWKLTWQYSNLISGIQIGMEMPKKLNPGPFVSRVSYFAPVSLFLFMFLVFVISMVKKINIHPINYFFIAAAFFSFHLLLAYLVDHIALHPSLLICSTVSIFLVISYMRLVIGIRFAFLEIGISQFVYLVLFSYAFFLEGFTGLAITICCILTLFIVMQYTAGLDWEAQFDRNRPPSG